MEQRNKEKKADEIHNNFSSSIILTYNLYVLLLLLEFNMSIIELHFYLIKFYQKYKFFFLSVFLSIIKIGKIIIQFKMLLDCRFFKKEKGLDGDVMMMIHRI